MRGWWKGGRVTSQWGDQKRGRRAVEDWEMGREGMAEVSKAPGLSNVYGGERKDGGSVEE